MTPERITKLRAQVDSLQDLLIRAYKKFLVLRPMLASKSLIDRIEVEERHAVFEQVRMWLYWDFVQELVKICDDSGGRAPSLRRMRDALGDEQTLTMLKDRYSRRTWSGVDKAVRELTRFIREQEKAELDTAFDKTYARFTERCDKLLSSDSLSRYKKIRDKLIAHNDLLQSDGTYGFFDIKRLNLKYGDERVLLEMIREIVDDLDLLVRNSFFAWDSLFEAQTRDVCVFWGIHSLD